MCRNIRPLFNFAPPATEEEIRAAALQYVRKVSGVSKPSQANQPGNGSRASRPRLLRSRPGTRAAMASDS
ncbi:MAG TPA: DUF2277 domain-containing protein [Polyangiaceae bacterium]